MREGNGRGCQGDAATRLRRRAKLRVDNYYYGDDDDDDDDALTYCPGLRFSTTSTCLYISSRFFVDWIFFASICFHRNVTEIFDRRKALDKKANRVIVGDYRKDVAGILDICGQICV